MSAVGASPRHDVAHALMLDPMPTTNNMITVQDHMCRELALVSAALGTVELRCWFHRHDHSSHRLIVLLIVLVIVLGPEQTDQTDFSG
jgi:hypothetical protein